MRQLIGVLDSTGRPIHVYDMVDYQGESFKVRWHGNRYVGYREVRGEGVTEAVIIEVSHLRESTVTQSVAVPSPGGIMNGPQIRQ